MASDTALAPDTIVHDGRYATMDGLRGIAAILVAIFHFQESLDLRPFLGFLAVDLFFVLSGFVLAHVYVRRFEGGLTAAGFIAQRIARFYPLYMIGFALGVLWIACAGLSAADLSSGSGSAGAIAMGALMLPALGTSLLYPLNGPAWSLFLEICVNIVFALALWKLATRHLVLVTALASFGLVAAIGAPGYLNVGFRWEELLGGSLRTLASFSIGMLICRLVGDRPRQRSWAALLLPLVIAVPMLVELGNAFLWLMSAIFLVFPAVIALSALYEPPEAWRKALCALGALSFPLYAVHWPIAKLMVPVTATLPFASGLALFLSVSIAAAYAAQRLVDEPVQQWVRGWSKRTRVQRQPEFTTISPAAR